MKTEATTITLKSGKTYNLASLTCIGWTEGDGSGHEGYSCWDHFEGSVYLGPDQHGIEPLFGVRGSVTEREAYHWAAANQGFDGSYDDWLSLSARHYTEEQDAQILRTLHQLADSIGMPPKSVVSRARTLLKM